jgi:hypothetical protein
MQGQANIQEELKQLAPGIPVATGCPMQVPVGYFDQLPTLATARAAATHTLALQIPQGYFDTLPQQLLHKIQAEAAIDHQESSHEEALPEVLSNLSKAMPNYVPDNYFATLPTDLVQQVKETDVPKIVPMRSRVQLWWAAAAAVLVAVAVGSLQWSTGPQAPVAGGTDAQATVEAVDAATLAAYLEANDTEEAYFAWYLMQGAETMEESITTIPTEQLEAYLAGMPGES